MSFKFENLDIWHRALSISHEVTIFSRQFPKDERFVLTSQIQRAADSISLNIAEGSSDKSDKEYSRFLGIALRSANEVVACLYLAKKREIISDENFQKTYQSILVLVRMIQSLRKKLDT